MNTKGEVYKEEVGELTQKEKMMTEGLATHTSWTSVSKEEVVNKTGLVDQQKGKTTQKQEFFF